MWRRHEACDGDDLRNMTCISLGYTDGTLGCKPDCSAFETADCGPPPAIEPGAPAVCGNDIIEGAEVCDGADLRGASCEGFGYASGDLDRAPDCGAYDKSDCA